MATKIKMLKTAMVGPRVRAKGWVGPADEDEAAALKKAGYAKDTNEANSDEPAARTKAATPAPAADAVDYEAILSGTVPEVSERLAGMSKSDLKALSKAEGKGQGRVTLIAAIDAAAANAE